MARLDPEDEARLKDIFADLKHEVTMHLATDEADVVDLIDAVTEPAGGRIKVVKLSPGVDDDRIRELGLEQAPGIAITSPLTSGRLHFYGAPQGYEMMTLIAALVDAGGGSDDPSMVSPEAQQSLDALTTDVHIKVFSTPGCPHCPRMARLAFRFAMTSPHVTASAIEASSFPELSEAYRVKAVPHTVINDAEAVIGAVAEDAFLEAMIRAVGPAGVGAAN